MSGAELLARTTRRLRARRLLHRGAQVLLALAGGTLLFRAGLPWPVAGAVAGILGFGLVHLLSPPAVTPALAATWRDRRTGGVAWRTWASRGDDDPFRSRLEREALATDPGTSPSWVHPRTGIILALAFAVSMTPLPSGRPLAVAPGGDRAAPGIATGPTQDREATPSQSEPTLPPGDEATEPGSDPAVPVSDGPEAAAPGSGASASGPADPSDLEDGLRVAGSGRDAGSGTSIDTPVPDGDPGSPGAGSSTARPGSGLVIPDLEPLVDVRNWTPAGDEGGSPESATRPTAVRTPGAPMVSAPVRAREATASWYDDEELRFLRALHARWTDKGETDG